jgi:hypothetical protein
MLKVSRMLIELVVEVPRWLRLAFRSTQSIQAEICSCAGSLLSTLSVALANKNARRLWAIWRAEGAALATAT